MKKLSSIALAGIVIVLATAASGHAAMPNGRPGFAGHPPTGHFQGHPAFNGHRFDGRRFDGRRFDGRFRSRVFIAAPFFVAPFYAPYAYPPAYTYEAPAPTYWYYCPSYGAYYPSVQSCPEPWVLVPG